MRRLLLLLPVLMLPLTACGGLSGTNQGGYITGDGSIVTWAPDKRGAPVEFSGTTLDGQRYDVSAMRGKPVVVNVWWEGCGPCKTEMPMLQEASQELAGHAGFVGINTRDTSISTAQAFQRNTGVTYPSIYSPDGKVLLAIQVLPRSTPSTVILDGEGRIAATLSGPIPSRLTLTSLVECAASDSAQNCEIDS